MQSLKLFLLVLTLLILPSATQAHPGKLDGNGGHYCRSNCDKWGVPWNEWHSHGGSTTEASAQKSTPAAKKTAVPSATKKAKTEVKKQVKETVKDRAPEESAQPGLYAVTKVVDGDTLTIKIDGKSQSVRLIGIDAPETKHPKKAVMCFGREASAKLNDLVGGKNVKLEADPSQGDQDMYKRLLRYVVLEDGTNVNKQLIAEGYAHEYTYRTPYSSQASFKTAERDAREQKKGLWADTACANPQ